MPGSRSRKRQLMMQGCPHEARADEADLVHDDLAVMLASDLVRQLGERRSVHCQRHRGKSRVSTCSDETLDARWTLTTRIRSLEVLFPDLPAGQLSLVEADDVERLVLSKAEGIAVRS